MSTGTTPSDMVAVFDGANNQWWIYYLSTEGEIKVIQGPKEGELEDSKKNPPYEHRVVNLPTGAPAPKVGSAQIGVCEYLDNAGNPQTRIYYLDKRDRLCELGWSSPGGWFKGALNSQEFKALSGSVITTAVTKEQLKVYYRGDDDDDGNPRLFVAWATRNEETWSRRAVMTF